VWSVWSAGNPFCLPSLRQLRGFVALWLCVIQLGSPLPFVPRLPMGRDGPHYNCKASVTELGYRFKQRRNSSASTRTWGSSIKVT
jgi:hypothetical protein